ncbi:hypothetical protein J4443_03840 [Candidatus Woesearchaeota archaeon]|nr:hypothetical protein [Candidatus Woesearchaeota archaeon]
MKCIHIGYTKIKMSDIFNAKVLCDGCNTRMEKTSILRNGFNVRALECPGCGKNYLHPEDEYKLEQFSKLRNKHFQVKLRIVGNSYTVSIPREIIDYQDEIQKRLNKMLFMALEEPEKLSIFFRKRVFE